MPSNQLGEIAKSFIFASSSGTNKYETLQYMDGSTSCGCKGWTMLRKGQSERSCRHTRMVEQEQTEGVALSSQDFTKGARVAVPVPRFAEPEEKATEKQVVSRGKKIRW